MTSEIREISLGSDCSTPSGGLASREGWGRWRRGLRLNDVSAPRGGVAHEETLTG